MNWPLKPLSELCLLAVDCVNKTAPVVDGPTPFKMIRTTNVKRGFIDTKTVRYVSENTYEKWTRRSRPLFGDVILTREAPVGEVGRCTFAESEQIFLGQRLFQYRPDPALLDWNYLAFALQSPQVQNKLQGLSFGATVPHIKVGDAEHLEIPYPPLLTQQAIGGLLAAYDDLIENNQTRISLLEESARLLYREWFVSFRYPGHAIEMSSELPQGWRTRPLAEMAEVNRASLGAKDKPEEIQYIDIASVETGVVLGATKMHYVDAPGRARRLVKHGDVIWSCVRPNR
jgi:type I restriction enzyme, S subunit